MIKISIFFLTIGLLVLARSTVAQRPEVLNGIKYEAEAATLLSTSGTNPFWVRSNKYGEVPLESQVFSLRGVAHKEYDSTRKFSYGYGMRAVLNVGTKNQFLLPELYAKVRYRAIELYAGRQHEIVGLVDSTLSSGSYAWSGNALPVPKVQIGIPTYRPILFKSKILSIKGIFSHGWLGSGDSTQNVYLNQSYLYLKIGKPHWRFHVYGGLNHQAQWGGKPTVPFYDAVTQTTVSTYANSFEAFLNVSLGIPIDYKDQKFRTGGQVYGEGNRAGNHLGTLDFALEYRGDRSRWLLYRQSLYDDGSLFYLNNISDGLNGLSWASQSKSALVQRVVVEYLQTSNQGGPYSARADVSHLRGQDNYFNNGVYEEGWVYRQNTIGTAFLMPLSHSTGLKREGALGSYNPKMIFNNRVNALILGIQSRIRKVELTTRISRSENLGNYEVDYPLSVNQLSLLQKVSFPFQKNSISASFAYDNQGLLENNMGLMLLISRKF